MNKAEIKTYSIMDTYDIVEQLYGKDPAVSKEQLAFMKKYTFKGKTLAEWNREALEAQGYDNSGNPSWMSAQSRLEDALIMCKLMWELKQRDKQDPIKRRWYQSELFIFGISIVSTSILLYIVYHG